MIPITKPFSPPIEEYQKLLTDIWKRNWFTNNGPLVKKLEFQLKDYLELKNLLYVCNGTIAIQIALKALGITKKVITTPFSFVATTSSLVWEGCTPVFVDIDSETFNIDASKIEASIDEDTEAILATHCFGNPCDIEAIEKIAKKHELKVIYDAAHCFGTSYKGKSVFEYGDISITSFHATKLFHTIEGGAVFTQDTEILKRMAYQRNFGHDGHEQYNGVGINGKNSEFHAAMGLVNLSHISSILEQRKKLCQNYDSLLMNLSVQKQNIASEVGYNYAYYPILFKTEELTLQMMAALEKHDIATRRYFYPSLSTLDYVGKFDTPCSNDIASRILCLPLYYELSFKEQEMIARILLQTQKDC